MHHIVNLCVIGYDAEASHKSVSRNVGCVASSACRPKLRRPNLSYVAPVAQEVVSP